MDDNYKLLTCCIVITTLQLDHFNQYFSSVFTSEDTSGETTFIPDQLTPDHVSCTDLHSPVYGSATFKPKIVAGRSPFLLPFLPFPYPFPPVMPFSSLLPLSLPTPFLCPPLSPSSTLPSP